MLSSTSTSGYSGIDALHVSSPVKYGPLAVRIYYLCLCHYVFASICLFVCLLSACRITPTPLNSLMQTFVELMAVWPKSNIMTVG